MMVTDAQYNAGRVLVNAKVVELSGLHKKLTRLHELHSRIVKRREMPYTEENMTTLLVYSMSAIFSNNWLMMEFWLNATSQVGEDIQHCIRIEHLRQHQAGRIGDLAERISNRVLEIKKEIDEIQARLKG